MSLPARDVLEMQLRRNESLPAHQQCSLYIRQMKAELASLDNPGAAPTNDTSSQTLPTATPGAVHELCANASCSAGGTCFCTLGFNLIFRAAELLKQSYPTMTIEQAALLAAELAVRDAGIVAGAYESADVAKGYARMLIAKACALVLDAEVSFPNIHTRIRVLLEAEQEIEAMLLSRAAHLRGLAGGAQ